MDPLSEIEAEFDKAERARARGNEGQARVCARRAAGIAAREYLARRGEYMRSPSAYDLLRRISEDAAVPAGLRATAARLTLQVDEDFNLPQGVDLIAEARQFCRELTSETGS